MRVAWTLVLGGLTALLCAPLQVVALTVTGGAGAVSTGLESSSDCPQYRTESTCFDHSVCEWTGKVCEAKPCYFLYSDKKACNAHTRCFWSNSSGECMPFDPRVDCAKEYSTESGCISNPKCSWSLAAAQCGPIPCSHLRSDNTCNGTNRCYWNTTSKICSDFTSVYCPLYKTDTACYRYPKCEWTGKVCEAKPCYFLYSDKKACNAHTRCFWSNSSGECMPFDPRVDCAKEYSTESGCISNPKCHWNLGTDKCGPIPCQLYGTLDQCNSTNRCHWDKSQKTCGDFRSAYCSGLQTQLACYRYPVCEWSGNGKDGACIAMPCAFLYGTKAECNAHARCHWDPKTSYCDTMSS